MPRPAFPIELVSNQKLAPRTIELTFRVDAPFAFEAGQFVSLLFEHKGEQFKRSYSLASSPELLAGENLFKVAIGLIPGGAASECFANAKPGDQFSMIGPFGLLTLPKELPERLVLVGTGTGMAPYRSMLPQLEKLISQGVKVHILMGTRLRSDVFYHQDFKALTDSSTDVQFEACLSKEEDIQPENGETSGRVQNRFPELHLNPEKDLVYLCGNPAMINDSVTILTEQGFGVRQVKREKYTFSR
ncbi:FAD-binding oxidoreductase [Sansalvadorimonas sp. 2012CJ34-2]|uniref:FAD-binding oxidoreductase n=1 Tax=Parendozoicomonas callyspongiae TaxID=2942213 RepID=A0ABT0PCI8_9GAMM|nr:FAD-binding oxidoreductase [Sansalvadorimonas sp. 2012CJ34-2]MCL6269103.1 FAD-binding oxidoreductase [Sansalvadorimonas sp. 2012CJ34-2]